MKVLLIGHPGSRQIVRASEYLINKYMPGFEFLFIEYTGEIGGWSKFVASFLNDIKDDLVILALDDYFLNAKINLDVYKKAIECMSGNVCVKLCDNTTEEFMEYPVTTQFSLWRRDFLIWVLGQTSTPWDFEISGSKIFKSSKKQVLLMPCLSYSTLSVLSSRWSGANLSGLSEEDVDFLRAEQMV